MIGFLRGRVAHLLADCCLLDVGGVGYRVYIASATRSRLHMGEEATLFTHLSVREDALTLYGFYNQEEYDIFQQLISVSGIGPKVALGILSAISVDKLCAAIHVDENAKIVVITEKGVGKRVEFSEFNAHGRGTGGQRIFGNVDDKGEIIGALTVQDDDSIMCITSQGTSLRVEASQISQQGRGSSGVRVVDITEPDYVVGIDRIARSEDDKLDS